MLTMRKIASFIRFTPRGYERVIWLQGPLNTVVVRRYNTSNSVNVHLTSKASCK